MSRDFSTLLSHPDKDEIISKLVSGISHKDVSNWLKLKYPQKEQQHLRLSAALLKDFVDGNMSLYNDMKQDLIAIKNGETIQREISESLKNNISYKERLQELADNEIDINKKMVGIVALIESRLEQYFDKMQENPTDLKPDYGLIKWFELLLNAAEKYNKIVNQAPDQIIQHNITMQLVDKHVAAFQDAIMCVLKEMDPDFAFIFLDKLNSKMEEVAIIDEKPASQEKRLKEATIISTQLSDIDAVDE